MRIIIILFILVTVNLIKSNHNNDINHSFENGSFVNRSYYSKWDNELVTNPTRHVRFIEAERCKTNTLSSTDTLDCLLKKLPELVKKDEYKYLLESDTRDVARYGEEVLQIAWSNYSSSELLIGFKDVVEYNEFVNVLNNQYVLLTVTRNSFHNEMELTLQVVKQNGDNTVYKLISAEVVW